LLFSAIIIDIIHRLLLKKKELATISKHFFLMWYVLVHPVYVRE